MNTLTKFRLIVNVVIGIAMLLHGQPAASYGGQVVSRAAALKVAQTLNLEKEIDSQITIIEDPQGAPVVQSLWGAELGAHIVATTRSLHVPLQGVSADSITDLSLHNAPSQGSSGRLSDNWKRLVFDDVEESFPTTGCRSQDDKDDGVDRKWGATLADKYRGSWSAWPARAGSDGITPVNNPIPANVRTWLICGPYDTRSAERFLVRYVQKLDLDRIGDSLFVGYSTNGENFTGVNFVGPLQKEWHANSVLMPNAVGKSSVWVGWLFESDADTHAGSGAWLDDLEALRYDSPSRTVDACAVSDPGNKGVNLPPIDPTYGPDPAMMIRSGDLTALDALIAADVRWVRLEFQSYNGTIDLVGYDRMIDTLCENHIAVLGLIDHNSLTRQDYAEVASDAAYRSEFASLSGMLAQYYGKRIGVWEIWNEPNLPKEVLNGAYLTPNQYARLLNAAYSKIKQANPTAKVIYGGLASAWVDSYTYFVESLNVLDNDLNGAWPFDAVAIHPYADTTHGQPDNRNPENYLKADDEISFPGDVTILDRFVKQMAHRQHGNTPIWVTELGWNSAKGSPNPPTCQAAVLVTEAEQADFLYKGFDVLFKEVNQRAVVKVFWYQFMDVGISGACVVSAHRAFVVPHSLAPQGEEATFDWLFGLYRSDKRTPKLSACAFKLYPGKGSCALTHFVHLPVINRAVTAQ